jgi:hypothetical protein
MLAVGCNAPPAPISSGGSQNNTVAWSPPEIYTPAPPLWPELDGHWILVTDLEYDYVLNGACLSITGGYVVGWFDACTGQNTIVLPAPIMYDDVGPWFVITLQGVGSMFFYTTALVYSQSYDVYIDTPLGEWLGYMERVP